METVFDSVFSSINAIVYRCRNDDEYTMEEIHGSVHSILGYPPEDILGNAVVSWIGMTAKEDEARLFREVDLAIEAGTSWDVAYRMRHAAGHYVWVRARGAAKHINGELAYLEGMVVRAQAEVDLRLEIEELLKSTRQENQNILFITGKIAKSLRQLGMLSVNARIEAGRLGEQGRGFDVIANAINELARQNSSALDDMADFLKPNQ